jgi:SpoVK/Ycf46/Vps4 family AAA+-type ATPase
MSTDNEFWRKAGIETGFEKIPLHCYVHLFHLEWHRNIWVHVQNLTTYRYKPELRDKLILPAHHRDLIDILTSDMNVLMQDIIEGKSGGTTILCKGAPGLGKTLTAEVYSEVVGKPLYRVHSGQLGTTAASVERTLSEILQRAARWAAILLLDEADVYIRCRDNDLEHNAIVAEFLRTLEYFNGLLFMTTNRIDDVDDAILSRCIATIKYEIPPKDDAKRLWKSMAEQFNAELPDELIETLTVIFAQASGRDIKELLKLTCKFCRGKQIPLSVDAFRQCAMFRGLAQADAAAA